MTAAVGLVVGALTGLLVATVGDTARWVILAATVVTACGILWRVLLKGVDILNEVRDGRRYIHGQLASRNGGGTVREQLDRIEQAVTNQGDTS